jgi:hypothetical protein
MKSRKMRKSQSDEKKRMIKLENRLKKEIGAKKSMTVIAILNAKNVSAGDRLKCALRDKYVDAAILHEFACQCAAAALKKAEVSDPRITAGPVLKRMFVKGSISAQELQDAKWTVFRAMERGRKTEDQLKKRFAANITVDAMDTCAVSAAKSSSWMEAEMATIGVSYKGDLMALVEKPDVDPVFEANESAREAAREAVYCEQIERLIGILTSAQIAA